MGIRLRLQSWKWMLGRYEFWGLVAILAYVAFVSAPNAWRYAYVRLADKPLFLEKKCPDRVTDWRPARCGFLYVRENRESGSGRVALPVIILQSEAEERRADPMLFIHGGPGAGSIVDFRGVAETWRRAIAGAPWLHDRDLILFDQRGTYLARPHLDCVNGAADGVERTDPIDVRRRVQACRRQLERQGIDPAAYSTSATARDVEDLRLALGIDRWNIWGASYGSRVALEVMRQFPSGIRSAILSGVYPPDLPGPHNGAENVAVFETVLQEIFRLCAANRDCRKAYPDLADRFKSAILRLRQRPMILNPEPNSQAGERTVMLDDVMLIEAIQYKLYDAEGLAEVPRFIDLVATGNHWQLEKEVVARPSELLDRTEYTVAWVVQCNDEGERTDQRPSHRSDFSRNMMRYVQQMEQLDVCRFWGATGKPLAARGPVRSEIPTLLLAGAFDVVTPAKWARRAGQTLPNSQLFVFPGHTHDVTFNSCAQTMMALFLERTEEQPSHRCFADQQAPELLRTDL